MELKNYLKDRFFKGVEFDPFKIRIIKVFPNFNKFKSSAISHINKLSF